MAISSVIVIATCPTAEAAVALSDGDTEMSNDESLTPDLAASDFKMIAKPGASGSAGKANAKSAWSSGETAPAALA